MVADKSPMSLRSVALRSAIVLQLVGNRRRQIGNQSIINQRLVDDYFRVIGDRSATVWGLFYQHLYLIFGKNKKEFCASCHHDNPKDAVVSLTTKHDAAAVVVMVLLGPNFQRLRVELLNKTSWHKFS